MSSDTKKIIIALPIILVIGYFAYTTFFASPAPLPSPDILPVGMDTMGRTIGGTMGTSDILGQDILVMVEKLRVISIDKSIFSGVALTHLQDFSSAVTPEPQGKSNPFVPLVSEKTK